MSKQPPPSFPKYASVILDLSINKSLDYGILPEQLPLAQPGARVEIPVRGRPCLGYILDIKDHPEHPSVKPIIRIVSDEVLITKDLFELALWMSRYYCCPLREIFKVILPASVRADMQPKQQLFVMRGKTIEELRQICEGLRNTHSSQAAILDVMLQVKKGILLSELLEKAQVSRSPVDTLAKKGWLVVDIVRVDRSPLLNEDYFQTKPKTLNSEQATALEKINSSLSQRRFETHLLFGVTGSGKTEVYLQAIDKALQMDLGVIMLVPEISLTAQTIERFRSRFNGKIAILHHRLSHGERLDEWQNIRSGKAKIVIGARSAIFSPVVNLGLIIVDEEHEHSYKQSDGQPSYHARDVAVVRGKLTHSAVVLGSATPSLESYFNAHKGKYTLTHLSLRADNASLPKVTIVDMKPEYEKAKGRTTFSDTLLDGIKKRISLGETSILFLNRRGYHTTQLCQSCNATVQCEHCAVAMTFHMGDNTLACHLCGYSLTPPPAKCKHCGAFDTLKFRGVGTEQVERALHAIFPEVRTLRVDADTTRHKGSCERLLRQFKSGKADVLIGTQMIAKGLHFPEVTLVGVLNGDANLQVPDFRASEHAFQLLTQVAGRAGRGVISGEVIIQTGIPDNGTIAHASRQDFPAFFEEEIAVRQMFNYPPFSHFVRFLFSGEDEKKTFGFAKEFHRQLAQHLPPEFELNAVIPAGHTKIQGKYRFHFLVRGQSVYTINKAIEAVRQSLPCPRDSKLLVDIDPLSTFF